MSTIDNTLSRRRVQSAVAEFIDNTMGSTNGDVLTGLVNLLATFITTHTTNNPTLRLAMTEIAVASIHSIIKADSPTLN